MSVSVRFAPVAIILLACASLDAIEIVVDYSYDTQRFFDTQQKREAIEAAAGRFSRVITSSLNAVDPEDGVAGWRIGFIHPGTGEPYQLSSAKDADRDPITARADEYSFDGLDQDEWTLFVGGHEMEMAAFGGTWTGLNPTHTFDDLDGPLHRGLVENAHLDSINDLPVWGGSVMFDIDMDWNFDLASTPLDGSTDFYSIALHEIGHALGMNTTWNQFAQNIDQDLDYAGQHAVDAFNRDNGANVAVLALERGDPHFADGAHQSYVFRPGGPNLVGTVGIDVKQDLLLDAYADFIEPDVQRLELTNVDVGVLADIGWSVLISSPHDLNVDGILDGNDVNLACNGGRDLNSLLADLQSVPGDLDFDGTVRFADFLRLAENFGQQGRYSDGDVTCNGDVDFVDFLTLSANFDATSTREEAASSVPEPNLFALFLSALCALTPFRRRR